MILRLMQAPLRTHIRFLCTKTRPKTTNFLCREEWKITKRSFSGQGKPESKILTAWKNLFGRYLLTTNTISSGLLMVFGDWIAQKIEMRNQNKLEQRIDNDRLWRMFIVGVLMGPMHHYVYFWMDHAMPGITLRNTIRKILIDQLLMSPICLALFFYASCFLEHKTMAQAEEELKSKFLIMYVGDWAFWPAAQYINFQYLDSKYRVGFVNVCTAAYNIFLSFMKHGFD